MCQSWFYKVVNPPPRKADHLSLATGDVVCGYIYISWAKSMNLNFCANMAGFCRDSHNHRVTNIYYINGTYIIIVALLRK